MSRDLSTYGACFCRLSAVACSPSTPIEFLMTNSYLRSFVEDQKDKYNQAGGLQEGRKVRQVVRTTKATQARNSCIKDSLEYEEAESTWKMNKFAGVPPKVHS